MQDIFLRERPKIPKKYRTKIQLNSTKGDILNFTEIELNTFIYVTKLPLCTIFRYSSIWIFKLTINMYIEMVRVLLEFYRSRILPFSFSLAEINLH